MSIAIYIIIALISGGIGFTVAWIASGKKTAVLKTQLELSEQERFKLDKKTAVLETQLELSEQERFKLDKKTEEINIKLEDLLQRNARLEKAEETVTTQFENLANKIFDAKNEKFKKESEKDIGQLLNPLKEKLSEFQKKVDSSFGEQIKEQVSLKTEIKNMFSINEKMTAQTEGLTKALKGDSKAQGNWGEVMLEKILEDSGLRKGTDYTLQGKGMGLKHAEDSSRRLLPDVIINLPDDKHIIVDAKVSLTHYEQYCSSEDIIERAGYLKKYLASIRKHVKDLEERRYQDTEKLGTPDFVLMFMPIEGAFSLAVQEDVQLHSYAWDKKVVIVCPSTLFATLRTISSIWKLELQNMNAQEIARQGGALYDKVAGFVEDMEGLGKKIEATQKSYDGAFKKLSSGNGNIIGRTKKIEALGLKTSKKLPKFADDESDEEAPAVKKIS